MRSIRRMLSLIDVRDDALLEPLELRIVLFLAGIRASLAETLDGFEQTGAMLRHIDGRMILDILAVIDRSPFHFHYRSVNLFDSHYFVGRYRGVSRLVRKIVACRAQIT